MLIHRYFCTDLQLAFVIRSSGVSLQDKVSPCMMSIGPVLQLAFIFLQTAV